MNIRLTLLLQLQVYNKSSLDIFSANIDYSKKEEYHRVSYSLRLSYSQNLNASIHFSLLISCNYRGSTADRLRISSVELWMNVPVHSNQNSLVTVSRCWCPRIQRNSTWAWSIVRWWILQNWRRRRRWGTRRTGRPCIPSGCTFSSSRTQVLRQVKTNVAFNARQCFIACVDRSIEVLPLPIASTRWLIDSTHRSSPPSTRTRRRRNTRRSSSRGSLRPLDQCGWPWWNRVSGCAAVKEGIHFIRVPLCKSILPRDQTWTGLLKFYYINQWTGFLLINNVILSWTVFGA